MSYLESSSLGDVTRGGQLLLHFLRMVWQVFHNFAGALIIGTIIFGVGIFIARTESYPRYLGYHYLIAWGDVHWFRNPEHIVDLDAPDGSRVRTTSSRIAASPEVQAVMADLKRHATRSAAMATVIAAGLFFFVIGWVWRSGFRQRLESHIRGAQIVEQR